MIGGRLLTLRDVAGELGCSVATVKRRVRAGVLPAFVDAVAARFKGPNATAQNRNEAAD